jgi:hypothetical protein
MLARRLISALLLALAAAFLGAGCTTKQPEDSSIPWSRPASWEGGVPGMGGPGFGGSGQ